MKGDFSRNTFDPSKHYSRVLMQQGRVQLDADWNEQASILTHYLRALARDLIGRHGTVDEGKSEDFMVEAQNKGFTIRPGRYYVDGILCENDLLPEQRVHPQLFLGASRDFKAMPSDYRPEAEPARTYGEELTEGRYLVYLDVWERHVTYVDDPAIRERALGGPDTATRAQVVWQVKVEPLDLQQLQELAAQEREAYWSRFWANRGQNRGLLSPSGGYRGAENRLYRVEIHDSGGAGVATFKWSRDNGPVIYPVSELAGDQAILVGLGPNSQLRLRIDDWVELVDDAGELGEHHGALFQVAKLDAEKWLVTLKGRLTHDYGRADACKSHLLLRRWDGPPRNVVEGKPLELEDGIAVEFSEGQGRATYRSGDYWLIPARAVSGDVEWLPLDIDGNPSRAPQPPHGVDHHYAELATVAVGEGGKIDPTDLRRAVKRTLFDSV